MVNKIDLDVRDFQTEIKRIEQEVQSIANDSIEERIKYGTRQLKLVTPVDTGEARSGWEFRINRTTGGYYDGTILNNVEHIVYLNDGHSSQAPQYFIEQVLSKIGLLN